MAKYMRIRLWPRTLDNKTVFFLCLLLASSGVVSPSVALLGGVLFGFLVTHPFRHEANSVSKFLLQASVVGLGFGMNIHQVADAGRSGVLYTAVGITLSLAAGLLLGMLAHVAHKSSLLISVGTAICGGSAIAAVAPVVDAGEEEITVSMGTVFLLNALALLIFPLIGFTLHLSQNQFGLWAALAIHDTSSVVGAAAKYGDQALVVGTTVKLARALWIVPVTLIAASVASRLDANLPKTKIKLPWFIALFCIAAAFNTWLPRLAVTYRTFDRLGRVGLAATLFLIGTQLTRETLRKVGMRPLVQGIALWILVACSSLFLIYKNYIHL